uniref:TF-B3 domain-containing protein n=1 Tax=Nymphaea colorata TaxID=210225 RepID=A0A5K0YYC4_9MAGN
MKNRTEGGSCSNMEDNGALFLQAVMAERKVHPKQKGKEVEAERERASLFLLLRSTRYRSKVLGWPEAVVRCHAMLPLVKSVCVKKLTATDTRSHHNRLLFRREDVHDLVFEELEEAERRIVCEEGGNGLLVSTLDEAGRPWALVLIYWSSNGSYVLKKDWTKLADSNGFHAHIDMNTSRVEPELGQLELG